MQVSLGLVKVILLSDDVEGTYKYQMLQLRLRPQASDPGDCQWVTLNTVHQENPEKNSPGVLRLGSYGSAARWPEDGSHGPARRFSNRSTALATDANHSSSVHTPALLSIVSYLLGLHPNRLGLLS